MSKKELLRTEHAELEDALRAEEAAEAVFNAAQDKTGESKQKLFSRFFAEGGLRLQWEVKANCVSIVLQRRLDDQLFEEVDLREYDMDSEVGSMLAAYMDGVKTGKCEFLSDLRRLKALALDRTFISFNDDSIYELDGEKWVLVYE